MIQGSIVALVTPMHANGDIDYDGFDHLLEWHIAIGTNAVVVLGTTGESPTITEDEHCDLIAYCVDTVNHRIPVIAGTGSNSTREALYFTEEARRSGADACLLVTPYYNKPSQEGLYQHFKTLAEQVDIPQILYNVPGRTAVDLLPETVERLSHIPNIVGIKEATGDLQRGLQLVASCGEQLAIYSGDDAIALPMMLGGALGNISVTANVAPDIMQQMCRLAIAGDAEAATALNERVALLHKRLFLEANPIPVKWALHAMGLISPGIRLPLIELQSQYHAPVTEALLAAGIQLAVPDLTRS